MKVVKKQNKFAGMICLAVLVSSLVGNITSPVNADVQDYINSKTASSSISDFETLGDWTKIAGTSLTADTVNFKEGTQGINFTAVNTTTTGDRTISLNATGKHFSVWAYISDIDKLDYIEITFWAGAKYFRFRVEGENQNKIATGWNKISLSRANFVFVASAVASDWAIIAKVRLKVASLSEQTVTVTFDDFRMVTDILPARISITFDDGNSTVYSDAKARMDAYGYKGIAAIITSIVGTSGVMTLPQLQTLQTDGWDIISHTETHPHLVSLSDAQLVSELQGSQQWLVDNGFVVGSRFLGVPYHDWNNTVMDYIKEYYLGSRCGNGFYSTIPPDEAYRVFVQEINSATTVSAVQYMIDNASYYNTWLVLLFHRLATPATDDIVTPTNFQSIIDYIHTKGIEVVTFSDVFDELIGISDSSVKLYYTNGTLTDLNYASNMLTLTVSASGISNTQVYCGSKGQPVTITPLSADGGYDVGTGIQTLVWTHSSPQTFTLDWTPISGDGDGDGNGGTTYYRLAVKVLKDSVPVPQASVSVDSTTSTTDSEGVASFSLRRGVYTVTATFGDETQTRQVDLRSDTEVTFALASGWSFPQFPFQINLPSIDDGTMRTVVFVGVILLVMLFLIRKKKIK